MRIFLKWLLAPILVPIILVIPKYRKMFVASFKEGVREEIRKRKL